MIPLVLILGIAHFAFAFLLAACWAGKRHHDDL
jgi:hypothetical protein